jgi:acetyl esterase/lipase
MTPPDTLILDLTEFMDPELRAGFETFPDAIDASAYPDEARRTVLAAAVARRPEPRQTVSRRDVTVAGPADNESGVPVRVYEPRERGDELPAILYVHGGGFIIGSLDGARPLAEELAEETNAVVVSMDYRLAPEHPFPAAPEDAYAALVWLAATTQELGVDRSRIAVVGHSAGGGIAAAVALMARDRGEVDVAFQAPVCACLDDRHITRSSEIIRDPRTWHRDRAQRAWAAYLGGLTGGEVSSYAAPARATDLTGLPPTFMMVGDLDLLRDENLDYARRLVEAGVATELHLYPGAFHGFEMLWPGASISRDANANLHAALKRALHPPSASPRSA